MIIVGAKDLGPTKYIYEYIKNLKEVYWIQTNKNRNIIKGKFISSKLTSIKKIPDLIITGTCIGPGLDKKLIIYAKRKKIKCISIIEHWSFLTERFKYNGKYLFPDYIFVTDKFSKNYLIEKVNFSPNKIKIIGNNYLSKLKPIKSIDKKYINKKEITFISQPHKNLENKLSKYLNIKNYFGFNEYDVVKILKSNLNINKEFTLKIKLHPNENINKYKCMISKNVKLCKRNVSKKIIINSSKFIIGMDSMLLLELYILGGNVISLRPEYKSKFYGDRFKLFPIIRDEKKLKKILLNKKEIKRKKFSFKKTNIFSILEKIKKS